MYIRHYMFVCYLFLMNYPLFILKDTAREQPKLRAAWVRHVGRASFPLWTCRPTSTEALWTPSVSSKEFSHKLWISIISKGRIEKEGIWLSILALLNEWETHTHTHKCLFPSNESAGIPKHNVDSLLGGTHGKVDAAF